MLGWGNARWDGESDILPLHVLHGLYLLRYERKNGFHRLVVEID